MNQSVRFLPEALDDLLETQGWYASREPALAQAFAGAIAYAVERIAQDQAAFPFVHGAVRRLVVRRFPYAVYFRGVGDARHSRTSGSQAMVRTQLIDLWSAQWRALGSFARKTAGSCPTALTLHSAKRTASLGPLLQQQRPLRATAS